MAKRVLLTRPAEDAERDRKVFERFGFEVEVLPTVAFRPLEFEVPKLESFDYAYFGSKRAVEFFLRRVGKLPDRTRVIAVGKATARRLEEFKVVPHLVLKGSVRRLLELAKDGLLKPGSLLAPGPKRPTPALFKLREVGFDLLHLPVYETVFVEHPAERVVETLRRTDAVVFTSPSTFEGLLRNLQKHKALLAEKIIVAIGPTTEEAVRRAGFEVFFTPPEPDPALLAKTLAEALNGT
ncbi:MAG: uroporphyrinogen-III synthase [Aquificae bacterium]|nr:uroporphyrinogen-III synthase [Aquificota bacterium]